ncbi:hypothetical protein C8R44DRAFT_985629 [Mycena epipterygia]|nr:hypothetical protein C8R44DRAFT_985629 [Mycena epipterygia]
MSAPPPAHLASTATADAEAQEQEREFTDDFSGLLHVLRDPPRRPPGSSGGRRSSYPSYYLSVSPLSSPSLPLLLLHPESLSALPQPNDKKNDSSPERGLLVAGAEADWGTEVYQQEPLQIAAPDCLRKLAVVDLMVNEVTNGFGLAVLPCPVHVTIGVVVHADTLDFFLKQCPRMAYLEVGDFMIPAALPNIPPDTIPLLHTLIAEPIDSRCDNFLDTGPLRTLHLPLAPPLASFAALASQFPDLRLLWLKTWRGRLLLGSGPSPPLSQSQDVPVLNNFSREQPELDDERTFDDLLPREEDFISDDEGDEGDTDVPLTIVMSDTEFILSTVNTEHFLQTILDWIFFGSLPLPPRLEFLPMEAPAPMQLPPVRQHRAIARLAPRYPSLREVQFGCASSKWRRAGDVWKSKAGGPVRRVGSSDVVNFFVALGKRRTIPPPDSATPSAESAPSFGTSMATLGAHSAVSLGKRKAAPSRDSSPSLPSRSSSPEMFRPASTPFNAHRNGTAR